MSPLDPRSTLRSLASRFSLLLALVLSAANLTRAQFVAVTGTTSTPIPGAGHDYIHMVNETVDPGSGSLSVRIQTPVPPGRGLTVPFFFGYDSNGVHELNVQTYPGGNGSAAQWSTTAMVNQIGGWAYDTPKVSFTSLQFSMYDPQTSQTYYCNVTTGYVFQDSAGTRHQLPIEYAYPTDPNDVTNACQYNANNGVGDLWPNFYISGSDGHVQAFFSPNDPTVTAPFLYVADSDGTVYTFGYMSNYPEQIEDRNGNLVTLFNGDPTTHPFTDSLQRSEISISGYQNLGGVQVGTTVSIAGLTNAYSVTWGTASANWNPNSTLISGTGSGGSSICGTLPVDSATAPVVTAITLPNGEQYKFDYSNNAYGMVDKITYPTGGYIQYTWGVNPQSASEFYSTNVNGSQYFCSFTYDKPVVLKRQVSFDGSTVALEQDFSYTPVTWTVVGTGGLVNWNSPKTVTVTTYDRARGSSYPGFNTVYNYASTNWGFVPIIGQNLIENPQIPVEQTIQYYSTSNALLRTETKGWYDTYDLACDLVTLNDGNGQIRGKFYSYNGGGAVTDLKEYDYVLTSTSSCTNNPTAPSSPLRETLTTYQTFASTPIYTNGPSILDRPATVQTYLGGTRGTLEAETDYSYDQFTIGSVSSATQHDETNYGPSKTSPRGNATTVVRKCLQSAPACSGGNPASTLTYDETGQVTSSTDPNNHTTQFSYADSYTVLSGGQNVSYTPSGNTNAYLTRITNPLSQTQSFTYDFNNGQPTISKDADNLTTTYLYNDPFARPTLTTRPDNGTTTVAYNDTALTVTTSKKINSSQTVTSVALSDGVGHVKQTLLTSDPQGTVYSDTAYDGLGRVYTVSNPYRTGSDPTTSSGTTTYYYDALSRRCIEVPPDGTQPPGGVCPTTQPANTIFTTYSGNTTSVTDQTGKSRKSVTDGLGRMTQVFEDPSGVNYETDYTFDALGNLLTVNQKGGSTNSALWRTRTFTYDSLSRLLTSANPETVTITYKYDSDSNCASPNSFLGLLVSKTDARGIRTCAQYDAINRETVRNYSNGDAPITTVYDGSNCLGLSTCQNIGQRTSVTDAVGSESWAYQVDATNQRSVHVNHRTTNRITKTSTYYLDLAGNLTQAVYPTGRVVNYTYNAANRPITAADGSNGITYATDFQTVPTGCLAGAVCYTPQGTFYALSIGQSSGFTGLNLTHTYNSRLQPNEFKASSSGGSAIDITYSFFDSSGHNAGHVYGITNNLDTTRSQTFTYDSLNRITSALTTSTYATSPSHCWGENYTFDAWGNLNSIAGTTNSNYTGCSQESGFSSTADGNNHLPAWAYDASGNAVNDGVHSYTWNAEGQLKSGGGVNYLYDGDGRRALKSTGTGKKTTVTKIYWYGSGGEILAETNSSGATTAEYIFLGGKRIAMIPAGGNPTYYIEDLLGTSRVLTTNTGVVCYDADFYPYGGERGYTNTCSQNYKFEGKERDTETGNDDFGARYYSNRFGRWLSADWSAVPVPVPYANLSNPQTLNLYAMVSDDPETFADLDGHECNETTGKGCFWRKLKNKIYYGHFVLNKDVEKSITKDQLDFARSYIKSQTNITDRQLDRLSNTRVIDIMNRVRLEQAEGMEGNGNSPVLGLLYPTGKLQHEWSHASDFGVSGNYDTANGAKFQQALEDIVNGPNTKEYDIEFRGQAGFKAYLDQLTGKVVVFDQNGSLAVAWDLGADQVRGVVVNGKLW